MKIKRHLAPVAGALLLVTGAASVALLGGGSATAAGNPSSAFGLELTIADNTAIDKLPSVVSTNGTEVTDELIDTDTLNPLLSGGVVQVKAKNGNALANVTGLGVGDGLLSQLPPDVKSQLDNVCKTIVDALGPLTDPINQQVVGPLLTQLNGVLKTISDATDGSPLNLSLLGALDLSNLTSLQLNGLCDVLAGRTKIVNAGTVIAECTGDTGKTTIADLKALGIPVNIPVTEPNAKVEIPGVVTITANEQIANADGTFTVNALHLNLLGQIDLTIASATCGEVTTDRESPSEAPSPTPVESHVPVTG
ncbi:choice-of-anchor P family protein [Pimelobacter simplex]|uniref:choice-of-anchor P family protein n=1 Tax=Nocardioides simplex TaxID=2045 RepID=UPI00214FF0E4|nr:choice-of-anchor P family protein [Pimelobacter simplex]UUW89082.1 choice-of-anchor P family protein [Pimelobacter simplex]UUW98586.1 choice-of-anchor P family protein [Pimelobacter simplex]